MLNNNSSAERINVVIPVLNRWLQTKSCLESLRGSNYKNLEIIVVDHGSTDETVRALRELYPEVTRVDADVSLWWAGAVNIGIREALRRGTRLILLMNNDCIVAPETITILAAHAKIHEDAVISSIHVSKQNNRVLNYPITSCLLLGFTTVKLPQISQKQSIPILRSTQLIVGGRGVIIPASVFQHVGLFDERNLPHYGSDHDFYLRCRKQGIQLYVATDATTYVDETGSTLANDLGRLNMKRFMDTFTNRRSHRNIHDLTNLFKVHYPIRGLYMFGVGLNLLRYILTYSWRRLFFVLKSRKTSKT